LGRRPRHLSGSDSSARIVCSIADQTQAERGLGRNVSAVAGLAAGRVAVGSAEAISPHHPMCPGGIAEAKKMLWLMLRYNVVNVCALMAFFTTPIVIVATNAGQAPRSPDAPSISPAQAQLSSPHPHFVDWPAHKCCDTGDHIAGRDCTPQLLVVSASACVSRFVTYTTASLDHSSLSLPKSHDAEVSSFSRTTPAGGPQ
jgi:hypothetical protein